MGKFRYFATFFGSPFVRLRLCRSHVRTVSGTPNKYPHPCGGGICLLRFLSASSNVRSNTRRLAASSRDFNLVFLPFREIPYRVRHGEFCFAKLQATSGLARRCLAEHAPKPPIITLSQVFRIATAYPIPGSILVAIENRIFGLPIPLQQIAGTIQYIINSDLHCAQMGGKNDGVLTWTKNG